MRKSTPESQIVNMCIRWLWLHKCFVWRNNSGAYRPEGSNRYIRYGTPGSADIIGTTAGGRFLACECKTAKGKLSPLQQAFKQHVEEHNGIYILARSVDDLEAFFYPKTPKGEINADNQIIKDGLITHYPPALAEDALRDYRVKPTGRRTRSLEESVNV